MIIELTQFQRNILPHFLKLTIFFSDQCMVYKTHCFERKYNSLLLKQKVISYLIRLSLDSLNSKNYSVPLDPSWIPHQSKCQQVNSNTAYFCSCILCSNQLKLSQRPHCCPLCFALPTARAYQCIQYLPSLPANPLRRTGGAGCITGS